VRFYVPEWEDHVDADYDFLHDEHSAINTDDREQAYIWDLFEYATTPVDGVLISREQVEESPGKFDRLTTHGIYESTELDLPEWLPTISDCGAWGYKQLPFPPYGNADMLSFYEALDVTVGVTIDHLVLGSGHTARLYLNEGAFSEAFTPDDLPDSLRDAVDVMVDSWPEEWPEYVEEYEPSICGAERIDSFDPTLFGGDPAEVIARLADDPRAVYRDDDMLSRYQLTLDNAAEMQELYEQGDYSFRLMCAIQGWDADSYVKATEEVLEMGHQYLGIGGVAGSPEEVVKTIVSAVGNRISDFNRGHDTRVDTHVFGFAKTGAFETVGRSGVTSFDSASMLRAAWTGGDNYHVDSEERYDALRVRYPNHRHDFSTSVEIALRSQQLHHALRAFDRNESIASTLRDWHETATKALDNLPNYLEAHRFDEQYNASRLRDIETAFRADYQYGRELKASFSGDLRGRLAKLLRSDDPDDPVPWDEYLELLANAQAVFDDRFPTQLSEVEAAENSDGEVGTFEQLWPLVEGYASADCIDDEEHLEEYERLLKDEPWTTCSCAICAEHGIEVAIFRGNNRNRRRGFHNTRRFYDQFQAELPKLLVLTRPSAKLSRAETVEDYLKDHHPDYWRAVHELPVAELGIITANGIHEWWETPPTSVSFDPDGIAEVLSETCIRYQDVFIDGTGWTPAQEIHDAIAGADCSVHVCDSTEELRTAVRDRLPFPMQSRLSNY
jgi:hypothetical protein